MSHTDQQKPPPSLAVLPRDPSSTPHTVLQTHADWGTASFTMAWKLAEQEMKERKLDLETFRSRRTIRHAINTEAVLGLTEEQCYDLATFDAHWGANLATRARMRAHAQELLAAAPNPAPTRHVSTAPYFQEETAKQQISDLFRTNFFLNQHMFVNIINY